MAMDYITRKKMAEALSKNAQEYIPNSGGLGILAQALSGAGAGYMNAQNQSYEKEQRKGLVDALSSGDQKKALDFAMASDIPAYQEFGLKSLQERMKPKDPIKLNNTVLDPVTFKPIYQETPEMTPYQKKRIELAEIQAGVPGGGYGKAPSGYRFKPDGTLDPIPGGPEDKKGNGKSLPATILKEIATNQGALNKIDSALTSAVNKKDAFGLMNMIPGRDRFDNADNLAARAAIADIGSQIIHNRSGAAVTISEMPRLVPFIPQTTDTPEQVKTKLAQLRKGIEEETNGYLTTFGAQGYDTAGLGQNMTPQVAAEPAPVKLQNIAPPTPAELAEYKRLKGIQ